ncbi:hypothetical protein CYLTODRAFT_489485 [Cylindrobasidium torrendii FP15055 ss-10]|uniref:BTB domain-containing protein n=1 Tax=Cylindrobasidium torrendii FP15055 ss-10 TaxID=1314674 RepID=A0A0D7BF72_9AGAR|nr:hypothetical protein CYLTODRAFT_489485 [Cylindrobasidium torrendii FP15055 ss-10]
MAHNVNRPSRPQASSNGASHLIIASAPFDTSTGSDIALRTSDNTVFFFQKCLLTLASPFFANLLSDGIPDKTFRGLPLCPVHDDSGTMHFILSLCSPNHISMEDLLAAVSAHPILSSLDKYIMNGARQRLLKTFEGGAAALINDSPFCAFGIARALGQDTIALQAAQQLLCIPMNEWATSDEAVVTSSDHLRLVQYFLHCGQAAVSAANIGICSLGHCDICHQYIPSHHSGLSLGSRVVHLRVNDRFLDYNGMERLQSILLARDTYRQCPGTRELPQDLIARICEVVKSTCVPPLDFATVHKSLNLTLEAMYDRINAAIDNVPLELDDV